MTLYIDEKASVPFKTRMAEDSAALAKALETEPDDGPEPLCDRLLQDRMFHNWPNEPIEADCFVLRDSRHTTMMGMADVGDWTIKTEVRSFLSNKKAVLRFVSMIMITLVDQRAAIAR